jgi:hypothetical protein
MSNKPLKVLVTTSGVGSRLGEITKFMNKALVRVGPKPVISYIIESYPETTNFVITLGYLGETVREFLTIAYPEKNFEFVEVDKYEGEGSSLLYSMLQAKCHLQEPFIYHACDTITGVLGDLPRQNWIGGIKGGGSSAYASFSTLGPRVTEMHHKGFSDADYLHVGLVGVFDYKEFWLKAEDVYSKKTSDQTVGDVEVLADLVGLGNYRVLELGNWFDIGNLDSLAKARSAFSDSSFHVLDKSAESIYKIGQKIIKFFSDPVVLANRVARVKYLNETVPKIEVTGKNFYRYRYVEGFLFSKVAKSANFLNLLKWAEDHLWVKSNKCDSVDFEKTCFEFYIAKTRKRLGDFFNKKCLVDKTDIINEKSVPDLANLLAKIDVGQICADPPSGYHGDFILDNIIQTGPTAFKLIDWRQDFGGDLRCGDKYYDIAKLAHNLVVNHEIIENNGYSVKFDSAGKIDVNIHRLQSLVECEEVLFKYLRMRGMNEKKVKILRALIWLNMSPLHHHPFDLFLFYFGKYNLSAALFESNNEI